MGNLMNNVMIKINRFYFYHFKISEKWGGLHPESDAFALLCIEIWGIIWAILFFVNPLGAIVEAGLSCVLSLILGYFLFKKDEKYEKIISNQKDGIGCCFLLAPGMIGKDVFQVRFGYISPAWIG